MEERIKINERMTSSKQPSEEKIRDLKQQGFQTVVNLRAQGEEDMPLSPQEEGRLVHQMGMEYVHIPVSSKEGPKPEQVDRFREEVERRPAPIFVHCRRGKRSGAFALMHEALKRGWSGEEAMTKAESLGYECEVPKLKEFFMNYINKRSGARA